MLLQRVFRPCSLTSNSRTLYMRPNSCSNGLPRTVRTTKSSPLTASLRHWFSSSRSQFSSSSHSQLRYYARRPPPRRGLFSFLDHIPENTIFYGIIGANATVFVMWYMSTQKYKQEGDPSAIFWMQQNFTSSWRNLVEGRIWTPLTACFSHQNLPHILMNGFTFFFMAPPVLQILGNKSFLGLYLGGGLFSSFASIAYAKITGKKDYHSHGASGAIYSVVSLLACAAPTLTFRIYGIIPVPAWLAVSGFFAYDLWSTMQEKTGNTDTVGHIGGILAGVGYFVMKRFKIF
ncbi:rhomboid-domain-containing protein [Agrocybe pediades]|nr:rhomboid-domain-containing protein [Agrocybe pediades]